MKNLTKSMPVEKRKNSGELGGVKKRSITDFFKSTPKHEENLEKIEKKVTVVIETVETNKETKQVKKEEKKEEKKETVYKVEENTDEDFTSICSHYNFNKDEWISSLTQDQRELLELEISTLHISWLAALHQTLTKPYFLKLKEFVNSQRSSKTIFPPIDQVYSWSQYTPLPDIKCLVLGQDPYHNFNQAHGLAFSVIEPTRPPPSLVNIYKTLAIDFPDFKVPDYKALAKLGNPGGGNLTKWAKQGVLMLNTCLTVEAHKANSHAKKGWEEFTEEVLKVALSYHTRDSMDNGFVIMGWGTPAQKRIEKIGFNNPKHSSNFLILKTVHPLPLSAHRGFFESQVFKKCNQWLHDKNMERINWGIIDGNKVE